MPGAITNPLAARILKLNLFLPDVSTPYALENIYTNMIIFENIFDNFITGMIQIEDSHDLVHSAPILGMGERLEIAFTSWKPQIKEFVFEKTFYIYKISDYVVNQGEGTVSYTMMFSTLPFFNNMEKRISRSFGSEDTPIKTTDAVKQICINQLGIDSSKLQVFEETRFGTYFVAPNWHPAKVINRFADLSLPSESSATEDKRSTFLFFEDSKGFNFVSLASIIEGRHIKQSEQHIFRLFYDNRVRKQQNPDQNIILAIESPNKFDHVRNIRTGTFNSTVYYHNILDKSVITKRWSYNDDIDKIAGVESSFEKIIDPIQKTDNAVFIHPSEGIYSHLTQFDLPWIQSSTAQRQLLNNYVYHVIVSGNSAHRLGAIVDITVPGSQLVKNQRMSGKFVVSGIVHTLQSGTEHHYTQNLELRKGTFKKT